MGENYGICVMGAMDRLWFQQTVLFSEPTSLLLVPPQDLKRPVPISESLPYQSSIMSIPEDELFSLSSPPQDDLDSEKETRHQRRRTSLNGIITSKFRSHSPSPSPQNCSAHLRNSDSVTRLQKTMSCKTLSELEVEEVKGFIDLGFEFNKSNLSPRMMSVLPGLQRLGCHKTEPKNAAIKVNADEVEKDDEIETNIEEDEEQRSSGVMRPYLSEAWLIKRPDSPLLNLKIPRVSAAADMKKHLKSWARTVATVIHQES